MAQRLWHVVRAVLFMLRKGMSKRKLAMDLHRGKIAGKALSKLMTTHGPRGAGLEVEFSCSNTPSYPSLHLIPTSKRGRRNHRRSHRGANGAEPGWYNYDAADIARVFEILNNEQLLNDDSPAPLALAATPSPTLWSSFGHSPAQVRQLRITDSPFLLRDDAAAEDDGQVDREAEEFIKKFYEQLRTQQSLAAATPDYEDARPVTGVAY